jgi:hypothetical protein
MPFCSACGVPVAHDARFCISCGTRMARRRASLIPNWRICLGIFVGATIMTTILALVSGRRAEPLADLPERIQALRREVEFCQQQHSKACVQEKARGLYLLYSAASQKDGVDRSVILDNWRGVAASGDLGYMPQQRR